MAVHSKPIAMTIVRTIAVFLKWDDATGDYAQSEKPEWNTAANGGQYIAFRSKAEKVEGIIRPGGSHFLFAETEDDKDMLSTLTVGDKVEVRNR